MEVLPIDTLHPEKRSLDAAAEAVLRGGVIAFPSDTHYALGCSLFDVSAVEMIARLKRRDPRYAVIALIPEPQQAYGLSLGLSLAAEKLMRAFWPGPLSLLFTAAAIVPKRVQGEGGTIALRCPRDPLSHALLERIGGPVVSSSANLSGKPPAESADEVVQTFGNQLDLVLDGGPRRGVVPSTLVDVSGARPKLLRRGLLDVASVLGRDFDDATGEGRDG